MHDHSYNDCCCYWPIDHGHHTLTRFPEDKPFDVGGAGFCKLGAFSLTFTVNS